MHAAEHDRFVALPEWLANAGGRPAAWRWHWLACPEGVSTDWWQSLAVTALAARWPGCIQAPTGVSGDRAPWPACVDGDVMEAADLSDAKSARWVAGRWYQQAPKRANAAHAASRQRALHLLQLVHAEADVHMLEAAFREDVALAYQLLRLVNSAAFGARREITSYSQAILLMGRQPLKRWLNLLVFAARDDDPRSAMLQAHVALRARGMEALAQITGQDRVTQDQAFIAGMLSALDVLFGEPLADLLRPLAIGDALRDTILTPAASAHPVAALLETWRAVEQRDLNTLTAHWRDWGLDGDGFLSAVVQACSWVLDLIQSGGAGGESSGT